MTRDGAIAIVLIGLALAAGRVPLAAVQASIESHDASSEVHVTRVEGAIVIDDPVLGERVRLTVAPQRIVSLTLASDVMLASLVPVERVVGVTSLVDVEGYSRATGHYPASIARVAASAEALLALEPDLVVLTGYSSPSTARALIDAGVAVLRVPSGRTLDEVRSSLELLARAVDAEDRAAPILARFDEERGSLARARSAERPRALFLAAGGFTHGPGTLTHELLELAGVTNVAEELGLDGLARIPVESIAVARPDVIVVAAADDEEAEAMIAALAPGLDTTLARARRVAIPSIEIEVTTPDCLSAAARLRDALR